MRHLLILLLLSESSAFLGPASVSRESNSFQSTRWAGNCAIAKEQEFSEFYRQDPDDWNRDSWLDSQSFEQQEAVRDLFKSIHEARQRRDYATSDKLSAKLRQFGVRIYNDPPVWTTQNVVPSSYARTKQIRFAKRCKELFGPRGHPYSQMGTSIQTSMCPLALKDINSLLSQHAQARLEGRYEDASAMLFELNINGVQCDTEKNLWRADGKKTWDDEHLIQNDNSVATPYEEAKFSDEPVISSQEMDRNRVRVRVKQLVNRRSDALLQDETFESHFLSLELWKSYRVTVCDSGRTWSFQNQESDQHESVSTLPQSAVDAKAKLLPPLLFAFTKAPGDGSSCRYTLSIHSRDLPSDETVRRIECLMEERAQKRGEGKFREADAIRAEIWTTYRVGLNDRLRQWSVGGVFDDTVAAE